MKGTAGISMKSLNLDAIEMQKLKNKDKRNRSPFMEGDPKLEVLNESGDHVAFSSKSGGTPKP